MDALSFIVGAVLSVILVGLAVMFVCLSGVYMDLNFVERTKSHLRAWRNSRS